MTSMFRDRLTDKMKNILNECDCSSKEMISSNIEAGLKHIDFDANPGAFEEKEITDMNNLVNVGKNANTNQVENKEENCASCIIDEIENMLGDEVDISADFSEEDTEEDNHEKSIEDLLGESNLIESLKKILNESDYAAPLDFVPDTRFNASDVLNELKAKLGKGSEGIHVDMYRKDNGDRIYTVSQIDKSKLPNKLEVVNAQLKLTDDGYVVDKVREDFPIKKD